MYTVVLIFVIIQSNYFHFPQDSPTSPRTTTTLQSPVRLCDPLSSGSINLSPCTVDDSHFHYPPRYDHRHPPNVCDITSKNLTSLDNSHPKSSGKACDVGTIDESTKAYASANGQTKNLTVLNSSNTITAKAKKYLNLQQSHNGSKYSANIFKSKCDSHDRTSDLEKIKQISDQEINSQHSIENKLENLKSTHSIIQNIPVKNRFAGINKVLSIKTLVVQSSNITPEVEVSEKPPIINKQSTTRTKINKVWFRSRRTPRLPSSKLSYNRKFKSQNSENETHQSNNIQIISDCYSTNSPIKSSGVPYRTKRRKKRIRVITKSTQTSLDFANDNQIVGKVINNECPAPPTTSLFNEAVPFGGSPMSPDPGKTTLETLAPFDSKPRKPLNNARRTLKLEVPLAAIETGEEFLSSLGSASSPYPSTYFSSFSSETSLSFFDSDRPSLSSVSFQPLSSLNSSHHESSSNLLSSRNSDPSSCSILKSSACSTPRPNENVNSINDCSSSTSSPSYSASCDGHLSATHTSLEDLKAGDVLFRTNFSSSINVVASHGCSSIVENTDNRARGVKHSECPSTHHSEPDKFHTVGNGDQSKCNASLLKMEKNEEYTLVPATETKLKVFDEILSVNSLSHEIVSSRNNHTSTTFINNTISSTDTVRNKLSLTLKPEYNITRHIKSIPFSDKNSLQAPDQVFGFSRDRSVSPNNLGVVSKFSRFQLNENNKQSFQQSDTFNNVSISSNFSISPEFPSSPNDTSSPSSRAVPRFPTFSPTFVEPVNTNDDSSDNDINFSPSDKNNSTDTFLSRLFSLLDFVCVRSFKRNVGDSSSIEFTYPPQTKHIRRSRSCLSCYKRQDSDPSAQDKSITKTRISTSHPAQPAVESNNQDDYENTPAKVWSLSSSNESAISISGRNIQSDFSSIVSNEDEDIVRSDSPIVTGQSYFTRNSENCSAFDSQNKFISTTEKLRCKFNTTNSPEDNSHRLDSAPLILAVPKECHRILSTHKHSKLSGTLETHYENPEESEEDEHISSLENSVKTKAEFDTTRSSESVSSDSPSDSCESERSQLLTQAPTSTFTKPNEDKKGLLTSTKLNTYVSDEHYCEGTTVDRPTNSNIDNVSRPVSRKISRSALISRTQSCRYPSSSAVLPTRNMHLNLSSGLREKSKGFVRRVSYDSEIAKPASTEAFAVLVSQLIVDEHRTDDDGSTSKSPNNLSRQMKQQMIQQKTMGLQNAPKG